MEEEEEGTQRLARRRHRAQGAAKVGASSGRLPQRQGKDGQVPRCVGGALRAFPAASPCPDTVFPAVLLPAAWRAPAPLRCRISRRRGRGLARSWPRGRISPRGPGARPGDYGALPATYILRRRRRRRRVQAGMAAAGGTASRRGPGRPCPFSIEHILSSRPDRSSPALAARPPPLADRQSPAEPAEPGTPKAPCTCCCCCGPRAAPGGPPESPVGLGEWALGVGVGSTGARRGRRGARPPAPCLTAPLPRRRAAAVAA